MDITKEQLEKLIKEEINSFLDEKMKEPSSSDSTPRKRKKSLGNPEDWMFAQDKSKERRRGRESEATDPPPRYYGGPRGRRPLQQVPGEEWRDDVVDVIEFEESQSRVGKILAKITNEEYEKVMREKLDNPFE